jgi:hypothetical protein
MSADEGNRLGSINLDAFKEVLEVRGDGLWDAANTTVTVLRLHGLSSGSKSRIFSAKLPDWRATPKTKKILPTN